jgi:hypothetical protein
MKEPIAPQATYDGSLKELAKAHLGLVKAVLFVLIITIPLSIACHWLVEYAFRNAHYHGSASGFGYYSYSYDDTLYSKALRVLGGILMFAVVLKGSVTLLLRFHRLAQLLLPHVAWYFTVLVLVPGLNLLVILLLWWSALAQMRMRGVRVGLFGIEPARVE